MICRISACSSDVLETNAMGVFLNLILRNYLEFSSQLHLQRVNGYVIVEWNQNIHKEQP